MSAPPIRFQEVRTWLFDKALPLWAGAGLDRERGGAVECLDLQGRDAGLHYKRTRVQARQVHVFCAAELMGWAPGAAAADHCWSFLSAHGRRDDGAWVRRLGRQGGVLDGSADAYDMAFVIYALAWRARAGRAGALSEAHATIDALDRLLSAGPGLGWRAAEDDPALLLNPHMHLLEAFVELAEATGDARAALYARDVLELFEDRMFDHARGVLPEDFGDHWQPIVGARRRIWPGHHYEWCWLLHRAGTVLGADLREEARALYDFAESHGLEPRTRLVDDQLKGEDLTPARTFRTWPQTEALKANLAMFEHQGLDTRARVAEITGHILDRYFAPAFPGGWRDQLDASLAPQEEVMPASTFYHLMIAFAELLRLEPRLSAG